MPALLATLHGFAFLLLGLALELPRLRRWAAGLLAAAAVAGLAAGVLDEGRRSLTTVHTYAGYEGAAMEVSMVRFPTGTVEADAWLWPLPFAGFAVVWIAVLLALGGRRLAGPWVLPLAFAWSGLAAWLGMQLTAAPGELVQPAGVDRFLWPAGLAFALVAARTASGLLALFLTVSAGTMLARLPVALFSKYASDQQLGTCLDVSQVRDIVNPLTQMQFSPRLGVGSPEQQFWLIWLEHVIFFPAVYLLSLFGIALGVYMFHRHGPAADAAAARARAS